ncbi:DUF5131 family protein [Tepidibacillus marianensis]|uniref:DUF5131 family protein n=1 Tax=Tepidibacillus marianensis TaxID=3131995 RepID=UPI0030CA7DFD
MNKTRIEWADYTWNPVTGCLHRCQYCYASKQVERFSGYDPLYNASFDFKAGCYTIKKPMYKRNAAGIVRKAPYPFDFEPTFHTYKLGEPARKKKPVTIFVCSMADLFGKWVPDEWIKQVLDACAAAPQHRYLFLTKNPARYYRLINLLPEAYGSGKLAFWWGTTATTAAEAAERTEILHTAGAGIARMFLSVEPIHEDLASSINYKAIKWLIVGSETGNRKGKVIPAKEWIDKIVRKCKEHNIPVFMKDSLLPIMGEGNIKREYPEELRENKEAKL